MATKTKALNGRVPEKLYARLEALRYRRSLRARRRVSQRELLVEALEALVRAGEAARG